jgi:outer membrane protein assembly factor BamB
MGVGAVLGTGSRRAAACLVVAMVLTGCMSLDLGQSFQPGTEDWVTQGGSSFRQHFVNASVSFPLVEKWRYNARAGFGPGSPLLVEETIFVSTRNGQVHGITLEDGDRRGREEFGEAIEGTPVVTDSVLYVPVSWEDPQILAYDFTQGRVLWRRNGTAVETGLAMRDRYLYAADVEGGLTAFDRATGDTVWTTPSDSLVSYRASPVLAGNTVIAVDDRGHVRAVDDGTGEILWERSLGEPVERSPTVLGETVFFPSVRGTLWALTVEGGDLEWSFQTDERPRRLVTPAVREQMLILAASDGMVRRISPADGTVVWTRRVGGPISAAPLLLRNTVILGSMDTNIYGLDLDSGIVRWKKSVEGRIKSAPVLRDQHLIVLAEPSYVYAFVPEATESMAVSGRTAAD